MKRSLLFLLLYISLGLSLSAQVQPNHYTIFESPNRQLFPLDGEWQRIIEEKNSVPISLPIIHTTPESYTIVKSIYIEDPKGKLLEWVTDGINHRVKLSINDQYIGEHNGGFFPFRIKIPREFLNTNNSVKVTLEVDETLSYQNTLPLHLMPKNPDSGYGFLGSTYLQERPSVSLELPTMNYSVNPAKNEVRLKPSFEIQSAEFISTIQNEIPENWQEEGAPITVSYSIFDKETKQLVTSDSKNVQIDSDRKISVDFKENTFSAGLWSLENHKTYQVKVQISSDGELLDQVEFPIGFRSVQVKGAEFFLNGKVVRLRGFTLVEQWKNPTNHSTSLYDRLKLIQKTGGNAVRFDANPPTQDALTICDSLGLLVFAQIPYFNIPYGLSTSQIIHAQSEQMLTELIHLNQSHPSLIAVGLGSGLTTHHDLEFINKMSETAHQLNSSLLTYVVTNNPVLSDNLPSVDWFGLSSLPPLLSDFTGLISGLDAKGRYFIASYGTEIEPNNENGYSDHLSQQYQAKYYMDRYKEIKSSDRISGSFVGALLDYSVGTPRLSVGNSDRFKVRMGVANDDLTPRKSLEYIQDLYNNQVTFNPPIGKSVREVKVIFPIVGVLVIFIFFLFSSQNRRFRENMIRSFSRPFSFFMDIRDQRIILGLQTFGLVLLLGVAWSLFLLSFGYGLRFSSTFDYLLSVLLPWTVIKEYVIHWIWSPGWGLFVLSLIFIVLLGLFISFIVFLGWIFKRKISFIQSLICVIWSSAPTLFIVVLAMVFEQIVISIPWLVPYVFYFMVYLFFWSLLRMIKGFRIITNAKTGRVYFISLFILIIAIGALVMHYDYYYDAPEYIVNAFQIFK